MVAPETHFRTSFFFTRYQESLWFVCVANFKFRHPMPLMSHFRHLFGIIFHVTLWFYCTIDIKETQNCNDLSSLGNFNSSYQRKLSNDSENVLRLVGNDIEAKKKKIFSGHVKEKDWTLIKMRSSSDCKRNTQVRGQGVSFRNNSQIDAGLLFWPSMAAGSRKTGLN